MQDRVAELLAERARFGSGATGGVALSILLHGSIAAAVVYAATHTPAPQTVSTLNIHFAQSPSIVQPVSASVPAPHPPAPIPQKLEIPEPIAEAPAPTTRPEPKTVPLSSFGQSTKKGSERPPAPIPHTPPSTPAPVHGIAGGVDIAIGTAGVTGLDADFPYTIYIERMKSLIAQRWLRPQVSQGVVATVSFSISRDGLIQDVKNEISSGNGTFDRAALRAVLEASPLPPLPFGYNGTYLGVHLTFR